MIGGRGSLFYENSFKKMNLVTFKMGLRKTVYEEWLKFIGMFGRKGKRDFRNGREETTVTLLEKCWDGHYINFMS